MRNTIPVKPHLLRKSGFTLLELVVVMSIIGLAMGMAVKLFVFNASDRVLRENLKDIEVLAQRARSIAIVQQTPYALRVSQHGVRMCPYVEAVYDDKQLEQVLMDEEANAASGEVVSKFSPVRDSVELNQFQVSTRMLGAVHWTNLQKDDAIIWRFDPNGICEPMGVRLEYEDGWIEGEFHPLSAAVRDVSMEARK